MEVLKVVNPGRFVFPLACLAAVAMLFISEGSYSQAVAAMKRTASRHSQLIIATQSTRLVDEFGCDNLVIVERDEANKCSVFRRLDEPSLADWLQRYSLSELWEKNVLGGRP